MVQRGLVPNRESAQAAIAAGNVVVGGGPATSPARLVSAAEPVRIIAPASPFVSRGGEKLAAALAEFGIDVVGLSVLDAGSSTGGFTDCVLQYGAASVTAVDVGRGQLDQGLRTDPRVRTHERTDIRNFDAAAEGPFDVVLADLSFISLRTVLPALLAASRPKGNLVVLVKPQFEVSSADVSRGRGVITDPCLWAQALADVGRALRGRGAAIMGVMASPLRGAHGNAEFLIHAVAPASGGPR